MSKLLHPSNPIVLVINSLQGGGAEKFVLTLGEAFFKLGFDVHVVRFDPKVEHILSDNLHYHLIDYKRYKWAKRGKLRDFIFAKAVDSYIKKHIGEPALVLVNLYRAYEVFYYSKLANVAYVLHNQLSEKLKLANISDKQKAFYQKIYTARPCIGVSDGVTQDYHRHFVTTQPTTSILNPIDYDAIQRQAIAFVPDFMPDINNYLVHVGSFKPQKAHDILLKAYAKSTQHKKLVLVGQGVLESEIKALISQLNLNDKVIMVGFQPNPYPYLKHASGFVFSSNFEGFALVIAEALALGVPAISTDCPSGPSEILPPQNLVAVGDTDALAQKMNQLMANPSQFVVPFNTEFLPITVAKRYLDFMNVSYQF